MADESAAALGDLARPESLLEGEDAPDLGTGSGMVSSRLGLQWVESCH